MFIPTKESILNMSPTEFEKYVLLILQQQMQEIENCHFEHNKIVEVSDGNYQIDGYIEFNLMGVTYKTLINISQILSAFGIDQWLKLLKIISYVPFSSLFSVFLCVLIISLTCFINSLNLSSSEGFMSFIKLNSHSSEEQIFLILSSVIEYTVLSFAG